MRGILPRSKRPVKQKSAKAPLIRKNILRNDGLVFRYNPVYRNIMGILRNLRDDLAGESSSDPDRPRNLRQKTVIVTAAVADTVAPPVKATAGTRIASISSRGTGLMFSVFGSRIP